MMSQIVAGISFDTEAISQELESGFAQATEIADGLARKDVPFREAHGIVGRLVSECKKKGVTLSEAEPLAMFSKEEWDEATSLDRPRLVRKVSVSVACGRALDSKEKMIAKAYANLLG